MIVKQESKENKLAIARAEADRLVDGLGLEIDPGIKEAVISLRAIGLNTSQSCEGHIDHGLPWPWVDVTAPDEPEERWQGELSEFSRVAKDKGLDIVKLRRGEPLDVYFEILRKVSDTPTKEFRAWSEKNIKMGKVLAKLVDEYNDGRVVGEAVRLKVDLSETRGSRLQSFVERPNDKIVEYTKIGSGKRQRELTFLHKRRAEMNSFAKYLIK